jgi:sensor domain CHASE-containing protein
MTTSNTLISISGKFVIISALVLAAFLMTVMTTAMANMKFQQQNNGDFKIVDARDIQG